MGLQRSHAEIRDEMTGIHEQLNTLMQMMQRNNLQPQQRQALRVPWNDIIEADEDPMGMMRPTIGADQEGRIIILLMVSNLRFHRLEEVVHPRNTWSGFRRLKRCLNGMNILKKGSARWQHLSLQIMLWKLEDSEEKGWRRGEYNVGNYEKSDEEEICSWLL